MKSRNSEVKRFRSFGFHDFKTSNLHIFIILIPVLVLTSMTFAQEHCFCNPPWIMDVVKPNILIILQMDRNSMYRRASTDMRYDPTKEYYGYFDPQGRYTNVGANYFVRQLAGQFPGNVLNWACMSRMDVVRRALFSGKGTPVGIPYNKIYANGGPDIIPNSYWPCTLSLNGSEYEFSKPSEDEIKIECISGPGGLLPNETIRTQIWDADLDPWCASHRGIIHQIGDKDRDRNWDPDAPRFGIMFFSKDILMNPNHWRAYVSQGIYLNEQKPAALESWLNDLCNSAPLAEFANPGEALFEAVHYFRYHSESHYTRGKGGGGVRDYTFGGTGTATDPYYTYPDFLPVWCRKSFVILIGDGEASGDHPSQSSNTCSHLPQGVLPYNFYDYDNDANPNDNVNNFDPNGLHNPGDDYALYGHVNDLRPDLDDKQNLIFYSLFAFGTKDTLYKDIAKNGGFNDLNNDNMPGPDPAEWDEDGDGDPDNFYAATSGEELEEAIKEILYDILAKVSSASGVAVVTTGTKVGGLTIQSQFYPLRKFASGERVEWTGTTYSLWLDPFGLIREDNDAPADHILNLLNDYVVTIQWDPMIGNVSVSRYQDLDGDGKNLNYVETVSLDDLIPTWDGGKWLWNNPPDARRIETFINAGIVSFELANAGILMPYLGVSNVAAAETVINYIRGQDFTGLRERTVAGDVWKLGDVINSGSVLSAAPVERYDFIYGDMSYARYYNKYRERQPVAYVGANDGMLHCFNAGRMVTQEDPVEVAKLDPGNLGELGEELWAYIPYNLLPHLQWLQDPDYCHDYYVDLKPYITDAQVFTSDADHPDGWGTLLVGGMRFGGIPCASGADIHKSAYFAIDITVPGAPVPLWEFSPADDSSYTLCYPTVVKVKNKWFLAYGSGPTGCGESDQQARIYVLDLKTGSQLAVHTLPDANSFITNIFACDWGIDYTVDRIYFGDCYGTAPNWYGRVYRISTNDNVDPTQWQMDMVMDMGLGHPVTAEGSVATDEYNNLWVYFGTGRLFTDADEGDTTRQLYVGFRDDTTFTPARTYNQLLNVTGYDVDTSGLVQPGDLPFDSLTIMVNARYGWYRTLDEAGERNFTTSLVFGGAVLFTSYIPTGDICSYGGEGKLYALYYRTGSAYTTAFLGDTLGVNRVALSLGSGIPSEPALYVSADQTKVFIQVGGGIVSPETGIPGLPRAGVILWKGK